MAHHIRHRLPKLRAAGDGTTRILAKDYVETLRLVPILPFAVTISIRSGFRTDGASIPVPLRRFIGNPFDTVRLIAAVCHDAIYATHLVPRTVADFIYYLALRARGKDAWNEKTPESIAENRRLVRVRFKVFKWRSGGVKSGGVNSTTHPLHHSPTPPLTH